MSSSRMPPEQVPPESLSYPLRVRATLARPFVSMTDIDELASWRRTHRWLAQADLQLDGQIDDADRDFLVTELVDTVYGDVNEDRIFDSADLVALFASGLYDQPSSVASWQTGDFDGDGRFDSLDLILALQSGAYQA